MKVVNPFQSPYFANTYIIGEEGEPCIVIDPGNNQNGCLDRYIEKHHAGKVLAYLLTHGHYDHTYGLTNVSHKAPLYIHEEDAKYLTDDRFNLLKGLMITGFDVNEVEDGETIQIGGHSFKVIHTPFHTPGSVCYYDDKDKVLFSGDTLFHLSVGRSDLPGGDGRKMKSSLDKLKALPNEAKVYPGHEQSSDIGTEKRLNPYLIS